MSKFKKWAIVPCIIIVISLYFLGLNLYNRIDRVDDVKNVALQTENTEAAVDDKAEEKQSLSDKINLNTATEEELKSLDGIGEVLARRIIEKREEVKGFNSIEELLSVEGIGDKIFDKIKNFVCVD